MSARNILDLNEIISYIMYQLLFHVDFETYGNPI
jgi:hypothetical protein